MGIFHSRARMGSRASFNVIRNFLYRSQGNFHGRCHLVVLDSLLRVKQDDGWDWNNYVNTGKVKTATLLGGVAAVNAFDYIAVGTSNQAESDTDTALIAEITDSGLARAQDATPSLTTTYVTNDTLEIYYSWTATATKTIYECGLFNDPSSGDMLCRSVLGTSKTVDNTDVLNGTYQFICA